LPAYLASLLANPAGALTTNWGHALRAWSGIFGRQHVRLVSFNHVLDAGLDPVRHFLDTFLADRLPDMAGVADLLGQAVYPSMPVWRIEIIRGLNALHAARGGTRGTAPRLWFLRALPTLEEDALRRTVEPFMAALTLADEQPNLVRLHGALWNTWGDRLVPPVLAGRLFEPGCRELCYLPDEARDEPAVRSLLDGLYDAFRTNSRPPVSRPVQRPSPPWHPESLAGRMPFLRRRGELTRATRAFLEARGYLEVETPCAVPAPGEEVHLRPFATGRTHPDGATEPLWLHTSPEFAMKKLLVGGAGPIFQFARVWRNEEGSALHAPEFTMLEWYRPHAGMDALIAETTDLLRAVLPPVVTCRGVTTDLSRIERLTVAEAFTRHAGADVLGTAGDAAALAASAGVGLRANETWEDLFFRLLLDRVEPAIGRTHPTFLTHWPADQAALARRDPDDPRVALRFELFVCGIELANAFVELTDAAEQRVRFEQDRARRHALYGPDWPMDEAFLAALAHGMPPSAGIALGFDRLAMLATGADRIGQVLWLPPPDLA
jgi:lysyl-tRNA synthetase class 2